MILLSEYERDAIAEAFNIGMGSAGNALSEMVGKEVILSVPYVNIDRKDVAATTMSDGIPESAVTGVKENFSARSMSGVREDFNGPFSGSALLLFPEDSSLELVRLLLQQPEEVDTDFLSEMEQEALVEVGNIILNACLASIAEIVGDEILNEIPVPVKGSLNEIITQTGSKESPDEDYVMHLHMKFHIDEVHIEGNIAFMMDINSIDVFRKKLAAFFGFDAA